MRVDTKAVQDMEAPKGMMYVGVIYKDGISANLAVCPKTGEYSVFSKEYAPILCTDQKGILKAVAAAYDNEARLDEDPPRRASRTGLMSCKLDAESVVAIREYGHGNFARGARRLTKILTGRVPVPPEFPSRSLWLEE